MHRQYKPRLVIRVAMLAALALTSLPLGGCIVYAPPHYHHWGY